MTGPLKTMKRFACHVLYAPFQECGSRSVVEVDESGNVRACFPLTEETNATQWLGGVIVLSPSSALEIHAAGESFADFLERALATAEGQPLYAWHVRGFDFARKEFMPQARLIRLK